MGEATMPPRESAINVATSQKQAENALATRSSAGQLTGDAAAPRCRPPWGTCHQRQLEADHGRESAGNHESQASFARSVTARAGDGVHVAELARAVLRSGHRDS